MIQYTLSNTPIERKLMCIELYNSRVSTRKISQQLQMSNETVYKILREYEIPIASYELNEMCFSKNTEEAMYFAGLLMADGCLTEIKNNKYNLYLDSSDRDVLEKYRIFLGSPRRRIQNGRSTYRIQVSNDNISRDIQRFGVVPRKSHMATIPTTDIALNRHFWRGLIDGDGWFNWNNRDTAMVGFGSASKRLVEQFTEFLDHYNLYKGNRIYERKDTANPFYSYVVRGSEAFDLIDVLYFDSTVHMDRKREKAMEFMYNRNRW